MTTMYPAPVLRVRSRGDQYAELPLRRPLKDVPKHAYVPLAPPVAANEFRFDDPQWDRPAPVEPDHRLRRRGSASHARPKLKTRDSDRSLRKEPREDRGPRKEPSGLRKEKLRPRGRDRRRDDDDARSVRSTRLVRRSHRHHQRDRLEERLLRLVRLMELLHLSRPRLRRTLLRYMHGVRVPRDAAIKAEGRIQLLLGEQEVLIKKMWAEVLLAWGYEVNIAPQDLRYKQCYVPLLLTMARDNYVLVRSVTRQSQKLTKTTLLRWFGREKDVPLPLVLLRSHLGGTQRLGLPPPNLKRMNQLMYGKQKYTPLEEPLPHVINGYVNVFRLLYEFDDDYIPAADDGDDFQFETRLVDTFQTALLVLDPLPPAPAPRLARPPANGTAATEPHEYRYGEVPKQLIPHNPHINPELQRFTPIVFQRQFMRALRVDLPDNFLLRFVRARKWDMDKACKMLVDLIAWRQEFPANDWLFEGDAPSYLGGTNPGLIKNFEREKLWVHGEDRDGSPIFWFQARKHFGLDATAAENERYAVTQIEWVRLFLREVTQGIDTCLIVFDLTGFTLRNADYLTIKFLAVAFEAHYPDCLGRVLIYNAPWIFSTVWSVIKHWLDPVVALKIHFIKSYNEFCAHVDPEFIPVEHGGRALMGGQYPVPRAGDQWPPKTKDREYRRLRIERDNLLMKYLSALIKWVEAIDPEESEGYLRERIALNIALLNNYIALDPYIRNPGLYDRNGTLTVAN